MVLSDIMDGKDMVLVFRISDIFDEIVFYRMVVSYLFVVQRVFTLIPSLINIWFIDRDMEILKAIIVL